MFIELCVGNYATYDELVDGLDGLFKTCMNNKSYTWIDFLNPKISYHTQHKNAFLYTNNKIQSNWTPIELIVLKKKRQMLYAIGHLNTNFNSNS